jgi:hypothetical protein
MHPPTLLLLPLTLLPLPPLLLLLSLLLPGFQ